jgi:hypothetical protein
MQCNARSEEAEHDNNPDKHEESQCKLSEVRLAYFEHPGSPCHPRMPERNRGEKKEKSKHNADDKRPEEKISEKDYFFGFHNGYFFFMTDV